MENYPIVPGRGIVTPQATFDRLEFLKSQGYHLPLLTQSDFSPEQISKNIESYIGSVNIPVGLLGPLCLNTEDASEYVFAPAATTEGALVASINRGAKVVSLSGGVNAHVIHQKMIRSPFFLFERISQCITFKNWVSKHFDQIKNNAEQYSGHACLNAIEAAITGRGVHLRFIYSTGDACGQNMTTKCTWHAALWINENFEIQTQVKPLHFVIEGNGSSDKKASQYAIIRGRGVHVVAECWLTEEMINRVLRVKSEDFLRYYHTSMTISQMDGMMGYNINAVNAIAAIFAATGQDLASIHESGNANIILEQTDEGLYFCLHLPSLVVGTIGGGTMLPRQREALGLMKCAKKGSLHRFARMIAAFALSLEISTSAAIVGDQFVAAHEKLGRNKPLE